MCIVTAKSYKTGQGQFYMQPCVVLYNSTKQNSTRLSIDFSPMKHYTGNLQNELVGLFSQDINFFLKFNILSGCTDQTGMILQSYCSTGYFRPPGGEPELSPKDRETEGTKTEPQPQNLLWNQPNQRNLLQKQCDSHFRSLGFFFILMY